jgi:MiaB/RimO family radical SAM methylthiotransferase
MGCVENQLDGARMERFLQANGWRLTESAAEADLVLVNSCGYTDALERSSLDALEQLQRSLKPGAEILLVGCLPAIHPEAADGGDGLKIIPRNLSALNRLINAQIPIEEVEANTLPPDEEHRDRFRAAMITFKRTVETLDRISPILLPRGLRQFRYIYDDRAYYIKISVGCLGRCSFCAVRRAKGKLLSRDPERVLKDLDDGLAQGYRDLVLSADEVGSYGRDKGTTLASLLREFLKRPGDYQIFLRNLDPEWLIADLDNLIPLFKTGRFPYIVAPVQTGSPEVLRWMDRGYTLEQVETAFARLRREIPAMILRTHFIVGFPGETERHFEETLEYARRLQVDHFKVHEYSARPHTRAALLPDQVPVEIIRKRARRLRKLGLMIYARRFFS